MLQGMALDGGGGGRGGGRNNRAHSDDSSWNEMNAMMGMGGPYGGGGGGGGGIKMGYNQGPRKCNIFVYGIPETYSDVDLMALFSSFGAILSCNVQKNLGTGSSKGFGFVSYSNSESASKAIKQMNGFMLANRRLNVRLKRERPVQHGGHPGHANMVCR